MRQISSGHAIPLSLPVDTLFQMIKKKKKKSEEQKKTRKKY